MHTVTVATASKEDYMGFHKTQVLGNLGTDPQLHHGGQGKPRATFSVAVNDRWTDGNGQPQKHPACS